MKKTVINEIEINGQMYVSKGTETKREFTGEIKIVILQRGWVYIGRFERNGNDCKLHNSFNIRIWGTTKGLAELVNGPTTDTILDKCDGTIEFDWLTVVHTISVNPESWPIIA